MAEVLIIEDMKGVQFAVSSMLRRAGHTVTVAENGELGLAQLKQKRFDLVMTDMLMPGVDGTEVLSYLGTLSNRPRVIAMSGGGAGVSADEALQMAKKQSDAFLQKPFDKAELMDTVNRLLNAQAKAI